jgi:hypothetical protein
MSFGRLASDNLISSRRATRGSAVAVGTSGPALVLLDVILTKHEKEFDSRHHHANFQQQLSRKQNNVWKDPLCAQLSRQTP